MQVTVSKKELQRVLARCQGVADKKGTMPVLGNVLLATRGSDQLGLAATDLFLAVSGEIPADVQVEGSVAIGARDLFERVKMMPDGQIDLTTSEGGATTIKAKGSARRYSLHGLAGSEFPELPKPDRDAKTLELGVRVLSELIAKTHFSIATDDTRPHLNSALFEWDGETVRMVTTDGHRLSKMEVKVAGSSAKSSMLIPLKAIGELKRLCEEARADDKSEDGAKLTLRQSGPNVFFSIAGFDFSVKLVDAQFPPYEQVIPQSTSHTATVPRDAVADALRAVSLAASDRTGGVKVTLTKDTVRLSSESPESGDGFDEVPVEYAGPDISIGFNARYIVDVLGVIDTENFELGLSGDLDPAVIRPTTAEGEAEYLAVVMPMRI